MHNYVQDNVPTRLAKVNRVLPGRLRFLVLFPVQHQHFADVLNRLGVQSGTDRFQRCFARIALHRAGPDLDQLVRRERAVDLRDHRVREAFLADVDDRVERVGAPLERLALGRRQL